MNMKWTKPFAEIGKDDAAIAGGKGASLGEMTQAGIPVPPGFVVVSGAFDHFIEASGLEADISEILGTVDTVDPAKTETVENASKKIQSLILDEGTPIPHAIVEETLASFKLLDTTFVAVRSSATAEDGASAAWAGQLDTYLNTTEKTLIENMKRCWASLYTPRAIFYRFEKGMMKFDVSVAVVVQKMVASDTSGIAFSVHPVTEDRNQMIIEGAWGLGEAVVSGQITPDSYVVTKKPLAIIDKSIAEQDKGLFRKEGGGNEWKDLPHESGGTQKLSDEQIMNLSRAVLTIEKHYGFPVDVEWGVEKEKIYILQSRPITTLKTYTPEMGVVTILKGMG